MVLPHVYCIFAKSTNSNSQFTLLFESRIGNLSKTLLLVSWAKIYNTLVAVKERIYE